MIQEFVFPLLPLVSALIVVVLIELQRQYSPDPARLFEWGMIVFCGLALLALISYGLYLLTYEWLRGIENSLCPSYQLQRVLGQYGCFRLFAIASRVGDPSKLIPSLYGLGASLVLFWPGRAAVTRRSWLLMFLIAPVLVALPMIGVGSTSPVLLVLLVPVLLVPLIWRLPARGRWGLAAFIIALCALVGLAWLYLYRYASLMENTGSPLAFIPQLLVTGLLPFSSPLVTARALHEWLRLREPGLKNSLLAPILWTVMAGLMILFSFYVLITESTWDRVLDGMSVLFIPAFGMVGVVTGAMLLAWALPGRRKLIAQVFGLVFALLWYIFPVLSLNTQRPGPAEITAENGQRIARALERYHARTGRYPAELDELVPRDILYIQQPFMFRELGWCYQSAAGNQSGGDFYRLGYVYRPFVAVPPEYFEARIVSSKGQIPEQTWICDEELQRQREKARGQFQVQ